MEAGKLAGLLAKVPIFARPSLPGLLAAFLAACEGFAPPSDGAREMARLYGQERVRAANLEWSLAYANAKIGVLERANVRIAEKLQACQEDDYSEARRRVERAEEDCKDRLAQSNAEWRTYYEQCEALQACVCPSGP